MTFLVIHRIIHRSVENYRNACNEGEQKEKPPESWRLSSSFPRSLTSDFFEQFLIDVEICVHVLHVVLIFQSFEQSDHLCRCRSLELDVVLRNHRHAGRTGSNTSL